MASLHSRGNLEETAMNAPFAYLSVMISIVLGLAVAHMLGAVVAAVMTVTYIVIFFSALPT
jgi:hypothetical protein